MYNYYKDFPTAEYKLPNGTKFHSTDLHVRFRILSTLRNLYLTTYVYQLEDGDRPDIIAHRYYGHADYAWLVMISGELYHYIDDFPLRADFFDKHVESSYGMSITDATNTIHHYEDADGDTVDYSVGADPISVYEHEHRHNESKRYIKLISKNYLPAIQKEFDNFFLEINKAHNG